jgi:hypothetical protein
VIENLIRKLKRRRDDLLEEEAVARREIFNAEE